MNLREYHKIETLFERDDKTKKLVEGKYRNPVVEYLKDQQWIFTEKIDGTNVRVYWDGHKVSFHGRTDKARLPEQLLKRLEYLFSGEDNEQLFEQKFGSTPVLLFGEGFGEKIQSGGNYIKGQDFILFDVMINEVFLKREDVADIAEYFLIDSAPIIVLGKIQKAIDYVKTKPDSLFGTAELEGLVGTPLVDIYDRFKNRIIVKIKSRDF